MPAIPPRDELRWLDERWTFVDEQKRLVSIRVRDVLEVEATLRYRYRAAAPVSSPLQRPAPPKPPPPKLECPSLGAKMPGPLKLDPRKPTPLALPIPPACSVTALRLQGITLPLDQAIVVRLFVNLPWAEVDPDADLPKHDLGYFCLAAHFGPGLAERHPPRPFDLVFRIPEEMEPLLARRDPSRPLSLLLLPVAIEDTPPARTALGIAKLSWMTGAV